MSILVLSGLLQDAEVVADLIEGGDTAVDLLVGVSGRELYADARLVLRYHRVAESCDEDSLLLHAGGELSSLGSVVDHHGDDGALRGEQVEAELLDLLLEVGDVVHQTVVELRRLLEDAEGLDAGTDERWGERVGEEVGT